MRELTFAIGSILHPLPIILGTIDPDLHTLAVFLISQPLPFIFPTFFWVRVLLLIFQVVSNGLIVCFKDALIIQIKEVVCVVGPHEVHFGLSTHESCSALDISLACWTL